MLDNRRRISDAAHRRAHRRVTLMMLLSSKPLRIIVPAFVLISLIMIARREIGPHYWPGACYEAHLEQRGGRRPGEVLLCSKHIPFANGLAGTRSS